MSTHEWGELKIKGIGPIWKGMIAQHKSTINIGFKYVSYLCNWNKLRKNSEDNNILFVVFQALVLYNTDHDRGKEGAPSPLKKVT